MVARCSARREAACRAGLAREALQNHITIGTWVCCEGAIGYGMPCRYRPFSPSDSPWSET